MTHALLCLLLRQAFLILDVNNGYAWGHLLGANEFPSSQETNTEPTPNLDRFLFVQIEGPLCYY